VAVAILYGSKKYSDSEKNWETTRQEASAIRSALEDVYEYVFGQHFYLFSDHLNLRFMHNSINRAVIRMRDFLSQFNMTVVHCPGIWNNADSLSRLEAESLIDSLPKSMISATEAKLEGKSMPISTGTNTEEDWLIDGDNRLQPQPGRATIQICSGIDEAVKGTPHKAQVLKTRTEQQLCFCLLCNLKEEWLDELIDEVEEITAPASILYTETLPVKEIRESEYIDWAKVLKIDSKDEYDTSVKEAQIWNHRHALNPTVSCAILKQPDSTSREDLTDDDLLWCDTIHRPALVLKSAVPRKINKNSKGKGRDSDILTESSTETLTDQRALKTKERGKRLLKITEPFLHEPLEPQTQCIPIPKTDYPEILDNETQTTPGDFRVALIRTPMTEDFRAIHNNESGHHGVDFSYRKLLKHFGSKWANERGEATKVKASLREFIESCPICQKVRGLKEKIKTKHSFIVSRPFLEVSVDFIIFKREDKNGNRYLLVAIDNFLKLVEMKPVSNRDAETVARFLLELQSRYGPMARLRSDKDGAFTGLLVKRLNDNRGTETTPCIPYHPQANSICERQNAIIMNHLNALILGCALGPESKVGWSDLIPKVFSLVNTTPKNPLGISPLSLVYGVFANYDQHLLEQTCANEPGSTSNPLDYLESLMAWQNKLLEISEDIQSQHFEKMHSKLNRADKTREFNVGDYVLQLRKSTGISGKPATTWVGPFLVLDRRENDPSHPVLDLMNLTDMKVKEASISDCRTFNTSWFEESNLHKELVRLAAIDENEYVVEQIISHQPAGETRTKSLSKYLFEVKWQEFDETTWEPYSGLKDLEPMEKYSKLHPGLKL